MTTQIAPISAAQHYASSAQFWEGRAKALQHELDQASARIVELEADAARFGAEAEIEAQNTADAER